jgi:Na+/melibiose symporter-like transporter
MALAGSSCSPTQRTVTDQRLRGVSGIALALRFLLELAGVAALAWWGIQTGTDDVGRAVLAIGAAGSLVVIWGLVVAPKARNRLAPRVRWLIGSGLLLVAAGALWAVGSTVAAALFAVLIVVDTLILLALDRDPTAGSDTSGDAP